MCAWGELRVAVTHGATCPRLIWASGVRAGMEGAELQLRTLGAVSLLQARAGARRGLGAVLGLLSGRWH